jgi:hypothetical protein
VAQVLTSFGIACFIGGVGSGVAAQIRYRSWRRLRVARGEKPLLRPFDMLEAFTGGEDSRSVRQFAIAFNALILIGVFFLAVRDSL